MIVGITGHRVLAPESLAWIEAAVGDALVGASVGVSCLAPGADSLFAHAVVARGVRLVAVLPFADYAAELDDRRELDALLARADEVVTLALGASKEEAYLAAGKLLVDRVDRLVAVWNGLPAAGVGGTGDVVDYARATGKPVVHLEPAARRIRTL